ncbi:MAG: hypothetical protein ACFWTO_13520 [Hafnia paralvei]|jgi:hypothetical protein
MRLSDSNGYCQARIVRSKTKKSKRINGIFYCVDTGFPRIYLRKEALNIGKFNFFLGGTFYNLLTNITGDREWFRKNQISDFLLDLLRYL